VEGVHEWKVCMSGRYAKVEGVQKWGKRCA